MLPSANEGMGRALVEAMAAGLPVVATKVGGIPALIEHGMNGLLVPSADAYALVEAMKSIIHQPDLARRLGEAAHQSIGARFGVSYMVRAIEALYEETLRGEGAW